MKNPIVIVVLLLLVGGGAFFGGIKYQESQPKTGQSMAEKRTRQFQQGFGQGLKAVNGEVINRDDKSITVKLQDGSSKIVIVSDTTAINKSAEGSKSDLKVGKRVAVLGTENSGGSITAQNIQLNPLR